MSLEDAADVLLLLDDPVYNILCKRLTHHADELWENDPVRALSLPEAPHLALVKTLVGLISQ